MSLDPKLQFLLDEAVKSAIVQFETDENVEVEELEATVTLDISISPDLNIHGRNKIRHL